MPAVWQALKSIGLLIAIMTVFFFSLSILCFNLFIEVLQTWKLANLKCIIITIFLSLQSTTIT